MEAGHAASVEPCCASICPRCAQHFSPDGRFCPFDGEPLQAAPDWDPNADPLLGTTVDNRYEIESVIGEGGMGVVYRTRHRALGKRFALKALRRDLASDPEIAVRFMQEARTAASVSHPGLVEITDFGRLASGQPFFVMELLEGLSLATLIRKGGPIPAARGVEIVRQIADALGAAHERSIVHRDLKPDNIHVSPSAQGRDVVTIVDFGLAKVIGASRLTRAGMVFGTPHYMSPEQAMGEPTDHRADVYALGVVMYEMFTGRVPFEADSYMGVLTKHMYMAPTPPSRLVGIDQLGVLEDITLRCLEKKPEHRYGSLRELSHDLEQAFETTGERPSVARQQRAIPRSLLADELELPSRAEHGLALDRVLPKPLARWPLMAVGFLFLAGIGCMLALRTPQAGSSPTASSRSFATGAMSPVVTAATVAVASVAAASAEGRASPGLVPSNEPVAARKPAAKAHADARAAVLLGVPAPAVTLRKKPVHVESSEIVDPWAK